MGDWSGWHMGSMWLGWMVVVAVFAAAGWLASRRGPPNTPPESPEDILKRRYAAGELEQEEYARRLSDLRR